MNTLRNRLAQGVTWARRSAHDEAVLQWQENPVGIILAVAFAAVCIGLALGG